MNSSPARTHYLNLIEKYGPATKRLDRTPMLRAMDAAGRTRADAKAERDFYGRAVPFQLPHAYPRGTVYEP